MCKFKSFWVLKPEQEGCAPKIIHFPGIDSHEEIAAKAGLRERSSASPHDGWGARVEYVPNWRANDITHKSAWVFQLDEERKPVWWDADCEDRAREACWQIVQAMFAADGEREGDSIVIGGTVSCRNGRLFGFGNCTMRGYDNCIMQGRGNCTMCGQGNCTMWGYGNCTMQGYDNCIMRGYGNCTMEGHSNCIMCGQGNCTMWGYGNCTMQGYDKCTVEPRSKYAVGIKRGGWDGSGHPFVLIPFELANKETA